MRKMKKTLFVSLLALVSLCTWGAEYHVALKAPVCASHPEYYPGVIGQFTDWNYSVPMSLNGSTGYYEATIHAEQGTNFKFREATCTDWSNEIYLSNGRNHWEPAPNLSFGEQSEIVIDYSAGKWSQCGDPDPDPDPEVKYSKTLPVLHIETENRAAVESKDVYLVANYWLDNLGIEGVESFGSKESPLPMQIKGRGNWTWLGFEKKPYRIKLDAKAALLGMKKNKHWTLLAHADDPFGWMKNTVGFLLSEQIELAYTPAQQPVEVVLNGDYIGLYMLTEQVRVDKDRINIVEQRDECTDADSITGGWYVEIDNYEEPNRIAFVEPANRWHAEQLVWVTPKTPEVLSNEQNNYLQSQMEALNTAIYADDAALCELLDIEESAKYYLVQELMSDCESYHGSCYLHKQMGADEKWKFGPVWDFGNSYNDRERYIYDEPYFSQVWIGQLCEHTCFTEATKKVWKHWKYYDYQSVETEINAFAAQISEAAKADAKRWPQYDHSDMQRQKNNFIHVFNKHVQWLSREWGEGEEDPMPEGVSNIGSECSASKTIVNGKLIILRDNRAYDAMGREIQKY